jgi:hypothetical protein
MKKYQMGFVGGIADAVANSIILLLITSFILGLVVATFFFLGVPVIWDWLKPLIHGWTA